MNEKLKTLINEAKLKGYLVFVRPRLKVIKLHGYKVLSYSEAEKELQNLLKGN